MPNGNEIIKAPVPTLAARDVDGLEMGVLADGTPFLSSRALARLCGVVPSAILGWLPSWDPSSEKPRDRKLKELLQAQGHLSEALLVKAVREGKPVNAHPDTVCMAVLEYYAFDVPGKNDAALNAYRYLARRSLREFIYTSVGYDPTNIVPDRWKQYHDRMLLNTLPRGYFSVFIEMSDIVLSSIQSGLVVDSHTVPDISVGQLWAKHWGDEKLELRFGERTKFPHVYPDYFPQAQAHPEAWIYPLSALAEFHLWMQEIYLPEKFPKYIAGKVKAGAILPSRAEILLKAVQLEDAPQLNE